VLANIHISFQLARTNVNKEQDTFNRLKYPDSHTWRDKSTICNGYWPDGNIVRISDPEMKPEMDTLHTDPRWIAYIKKKYAGKNRYESK
jgi:hypothetical protein